MLFVSLLDSWEIPPLAGGHPQPFDPSYAEIQVQRFDASIRSAASFLHSLAQLIIDLRDPIFLDVAISPVQLRQCVCSMSFTP